MMGRAVNGANLWWAVRLAKFEGYFLREEAQRTCSVYVNR